MSDLVPTRVEEGGSIDANTGRCEEICIDCGFTCDDRRCDLDLLPPHNLHFHPLGMGTHPTKSRHIFLVKSEAKIPKTSSVDDVNFVNAIMREHPPERET